MYNLQCFNEKHDGSGKDVFRAWEERLDRSKVIINEELTHYLFLEKKKQVVESDDDPELLFSIPFNGAVKITGLCVIGENDPSHPNTVKLSVKWFIFWEWEEVIFCLFYYRWSNLPELRFDNARGKAHQEIALTYDPSGTLAYQVK